MRFFGSIVTINRERGYAFIRFDDDSGVDIFCHARAVRRAANDGRFDRLVVGTRVSFEIGESSGRSCAQQVELENEASSPQSLDEPLAVLLAAIPHVRVSSDDGAWWALTPNGARPLTAQEMWQIARAVLREADLYRDDYEIDRLLDEARLRVPLLEWQEEAA